METHLPDDLDPINHENANKTPSHQKGQEQSDDWWPTILNSV